MIFLIFKYLSLLDYSKMDSKIKVVRTTSENPDFISLITIFDTFLWERYPELKKEYWGNNLIEFNANVVLIYLDGKAVASGCFKKYNENTVELKRMFVLPEARGLGLAQKVIRELEKKAKNQGYQIMILETLYKQTEAISLYQKVGFEIVENYEPYIGLSNSICMSRRINLKKKTFSIKNWSEDDRPREKLLLKGIDALSDAELIAILIGSGSRSESAVDLSKRILAKAENLNALGKMSLPQLMQFEGIGEAKAISIVAALELGRRQRSEETLKFKNKVTSSKVIFEIMRPIIGELPHEEFWVFFLNNTNKIISKVQLSKGGITATIVDVRLVFKFALETRATSLILCHNHPSGNLEPSHADKEITKKLKLAGDMLDVKVLDHLIITETKYYSFVDEGIF
jgi:DNA repair protein RadC